MQVLETLRLMMMVMVRWPHRRAHGVVAVLMVRRTSPMRVILGGMMLMRMIRGRQEARRRRIHAWAVTSRSAQCCCRPRSMEALDEREWRSRELPDSHSREIIATRVFSRGSFESSLRREALPPLPSLQTNNRTTVRMPLKRNREMSRAFSRASYSPLLKVESLPTPPSPVISHVYGSMMIVR